MIEYSSPCMALFNHSNVFSLILDWINVSEVSVLLSGVLWFWRKILSHALSNRPTFINEKLNSTSSLASESTVLSLVANRQLPQCLWRICSKFDLQDLCRRITPKLEGD